jgi:cytoskeletal protein CcmA (bactofilin family)
MFSKQTSDTLQTPAFSGSSGEKRRSILQDDVWIKGDWTSHETVEFGGNIIGNLTADILVITTEGRVTGNVRARNVIIDGQLRGTVSALNVIVKSSATVVADIRAEQLSIESGAEIQGNIQVVGKSAEN